MGQQVSKKMLCFTGSYRNMRSYSLVTSRHVTQKPRIFNTEYNIMFGPVRFGPKIIKYSLMTSRYVTPTKRQPLDGL